MENNYAIEVKDLCISYRNFKKYSIKKSLLHLKRAKADVFEAVRHISFNVEKGEILGIIGKNGSGKINAAESIGRHFFAGFGNDRS